MADDVDVLVLTALKEELDALLQVTAAISEPWTSTGGELPVHRAVLDGRSGPLRVAAARLTRMGPTATASLATRLIETMQPRCIAMCGVCAGHPEDTDLGDVVIAERLFQHDEGKSRHDGFQGDLSVDALRDDWLRVAQDMAGLGIGVDLYADPSGDDWKWWFLERLAAERDPLRSHAFRRYIPDERRQECIQALRSARLIKLKGMEFMLTRAGKAAVEEHRVLHGTLVTAHPFFIHVGPMGSGNAVEASGAIWGRLAAGGMRKLLAVEMEAAAIGRIAYERQRPFAVVKGVMDHADRHKSDRFKGFAARAAAEVLCKLLREVVAPSGERAPTGVATMAEHGRLTSPARVPEDSPPPPPRPTDRFVGRTDELAKLAAALLPAAGPPRPVAVVALQGMPGVGKSFLVDHFAREHADRLPGGYHVLALEPDAALSVDTLGGRLATLVGQHTWGAPGAWAELVARLRAPVALVHVENVDSDGSVVAVVDLAHRLTGCALVLSGRSRRFGRESPFQALEVRPMDEPTALAQLAAELGPARDAADTAERRRLAYALGYLPLALHLAAGYLADGHSVGGFLELLRARGLALEPADLADPRYRLDPARFVLSTTFALSLDLLARRFDATAMAGFAVLGHAPGAGVRGSLGAAMAGLEEGTFEALMVEAVRLSLASGSADAGWSIHPLLAELLRGRVLDGAWLDRMTAWFVARLPERAPGEADVQGRCWGEIQREGAALERWLQDVPEADLAIVERAGSTFAMWSGPFRVWMRFCERVLENVKDPWECSNALWTLTQVALNAGDLDQAADAAQLKRSLNEKRGEEKEAAIAVGALADILQARGELDEALRVRREEELPVYERLGDVRSRAVALGKVADILQIRGKLDEALGIRREQLLVYERLGDVRSRAVTLGNVAYILEKRGELDEALRIRREEQLPVYELLRDVRSLLVGRVNLATSLLARGDLGDREAAARLIELALASAEAIQSPEASMIRAIQRKHKL